MFINACLIRCTDVFPSRVGAHSLYLCKSTSPTPPPPTPQTCVVAGSGGGGCLINHQSRGAKRTFIYGNDVKVKNSARCSHVGFPEYGMTNANILKWGLPPSINPRLARRRVPRTTDGKRLKTAWSLTVALPESLTATAWSLPVALPEFPTATAWSLTVALPESPTATSQPLPGA